MQLLPIIVEGVKAVTGLIAEKGKKTAELTKNAVNSMAGRAEWLVALVFLVWAAPFIHGYIDADQAGRLADIYKAYPQWYVDGFTELSYAAAGIAVLMKLGRR